MPIKLIKRYILKERETIMGSTYLSIKKNRKGLLSNRVISFLWITSSLLEYLFLLYFKVFLPNKNKDVLICDRYLYDAIVDFALSCSMPVSRIESLLNNPVSRLFPRPCRLYFIDISAEIGASRKTDGTSLAYLEDRVPMYRHIADIVKATIVDGTLSLDDIKKIIRDDVKKVIKENKIRNYHSLLSSLKFTK